ncbi:hypothetical protein [Nonomuraea sp. WAC 01424]|uniref:hypothetical protein n=1 Tax=Nonomuraea sp. WAC 01424 TaxID=2203200 RepID=UPI00163C7BF7|nr:hypothetical protein [Nonomuraea sp. WAC 01424]
MDVLALGLGHRGEVGEQQPAWAATRPRRFISTTVRMTRQYGACALNCRAGASAASNCGRTFTRVEIAAKIFSRCVRGRGVQL